MDKERETFQIGLSSFNLLPYSAFLPTSWTAKRAKEAGCSGLEITPLRMPVMELLVASRLSCSPEQVKSGHREWTPYFSAWRVLRRKYGSPTYIDVLIFPPTKKCLTALQRMENLYNVPIITIRKEDGQQEIREQFKKPLVLEVYDGLNLTIEEIKAQVKKGNFSGVSLDTEHLRGLGPWEEVLEELLLLTKVVHFNPKDTKELKAVLKGDYHSRIGRIMARIKERGYNKLVTVKLDGRIARKAFGFSALTPQKLQEYHKAVVEFIKNV